MESLSFTHGTDRRAEGSVGWHGLGRISGGTGPLHGQAAAAGGVVDRPRGGPGRRPRPPKLYRIGEVVAYSGMSRQTVHNYTAMGLLHEVRWTDGGHRLYDESVFERLDQIAEMKTQGKSLQDLREHFARLDGS